MKTLMKVDDQEKKQRRCVIIVAYGGMWFLPAPTVFPLGQKPQADLNLSRHFKSYLLLLLIT